MILASAAHADTFTVRIKMKNAKGGMDLVPVGEITRTNGKVTIKGIPAPAIDAISDKFIAEWKAFKLPAKVTITENISSNTGMQPDFKDHSATFVPGDKLYTAAVIREFVTARGFEPLGMRSVKFIEYDRTAESPAGADDRASTHYNFRKGTGDLDYNDEGYDAFYIKAPLRPGTMGKPDMVLRPSVTNPKLGVAQNWDDGMQHIAIMKVFKDGHVEVEAERAHQQFVDQTFSWEQDQEVKLIVDASEWKTIKIKKQSPMLLEAFIVGTLEHGSYYDVTPVIDPARFK